MRAAVALLALGLLVSQVSAQALLVAFTLASIGLGSGDIVISQQVKERLDRLNFVYNDLVYSEIANSDAAQIANATGDYMLDVYDRLARRLGYAGRVDYLNDLHNFEKERNASAVGVAELNEEAGDHRTLAMAAMMGSGIGAIMDWKVRLKWSKAELGLGDGPTIWGNSPSYKYFTNPQTRAQMKTRLYCHRGMQDVRAKLFKGIIDFDEADRRINQYLALTDLAKPENQGIKIQAGLLDGLDHVEMSNHWKKINGRANSAKLAAISTLDNLGKALEIFGFITSLVGIIQGQDAKRDIERAIRDVAIIRFQQYRAKLEGDIWKEYEGQITTAAEVWGAQHDSAADIGGCYRSVDDRLAEASSNITTGMFARFDAMTNDMVYNAMRAKDVLFDYHSLPYDPSKEELFRLLRERNLLYPEDDNTTPDTSIFDEEYTGEIPAIQTNGSNVRYLAFQQNQGAMWKLTGPAWTIQLRQTEMLQTARYRLVQVGDRAGDRISFKLDRVNGVPLPENQQVNLTLHLMNGQGRLVWPGKADMLVDPATPSNLIAMNGWTIYSADSIPPANSADWKSNMPQNFEECNRVRGWQATVWQNQVYSNNKEIARNMTYVESCIVSEEDGEYYKESPFVQLDLAGEMMHYKKYRDGQLTTDRPLPVNPRSYKARVYVD